MKVSKNGRPLGESDAQGLLCGSLMRGLCAFTTLKVFGGKLIWLESHLLKLAESASVLGLHYDVAKIQEAVLLGTRDIDSVDGWCRISLIRDSISADGKTDVFVVLSGNSTPAPMQLKVSVTQIHAQIWPHDVPKSPDYAQRTIAALRAHSQGFDDVILWDPAFGVLGGSTSNIFVRIGETWLSPPAGYTVRDGLTRHWVLSRIKTWGERLVQESFSVEHLSDAHEIFLCSSVRGVVGVHMVEGYSNELPEGATTSKLRRTLLQQWRDGA